MTASGQAVGATRWIRPIGLAVALAVHVSLWLCYYLPEAKALVGDEAMYLDAARRVWAEGHSGMGALWPPFYAWFLAPLVAVVGGSLWLVQLAQTVCLVVASWLVRDLVAASLDDEPAGDIAMWTFLAYPPLVAYTHYLWPEILHLTLMLAVAALARRAPQSPVAAFASGLLLALCVQTKVLLVLFVPLLAIGLWWYLPRGRRGVAIALTGLAFVVGALPTVVAQQRDFGRPMLASSGWFNVWAGINDVSRREFVDVVVAGEYLRYEQSARSVARRNELMREKSLARVRERGLIRTLRDQVGRQYFRLFDKDSFLTAQLPGGRLWSQRPAYQGRPGPLSSTLRGLSRVGWALLFAASAWGMAVFPYRRLPVGRWALAFIGIQLALFLVLHVKTRYRVQMLPVLLLFATFAARRLAAGDVPTSPLRRSAAAAAASLALWLTFGADWF